MCIVSLKYIAAIVACAAAVCEALEPLDKKDWVDPGNMFHYNTNTATREMDPAFHRKDRRVSAESGGAADSVGAIDSVVSADNVGAADSMVPPESDGTLATRTDNVKTGELVSSRSMDLGNVEGRPYIDTSQLVLKRLVRHLLTHFRYKNSKRSGNDEYDDTVELRYEASLAITTGDLEILRRFALDEPSVSKTLVALTDVDDILSHLIRDVRSMNGESEFEYSNLQPWLQFVKENAAVITAILAILVMIPLLRRLNTLGILVLIAVFITLLSFVWQWIHMHQKLQAERAAEMTQYNEIPSECRKWELSGFQWFFSLFSSKDSCKKYYALMMVDTQFQINPLMVIAGLLGSVMETSFGSMGTSIGQFYSHLMEPFSILSRWFIVAIVSVMLCVIIIQISGQVILNSIPTLIYGRRGEYQGRRLMIEEIPVHRNQRLESASENTMPLPSTSSCGTCHICSHQTCRQGVMTSCQQHLHQHPPLHNCQQLGHCCYVQSLSLPSVNPFSKEQIKPEEAIGSASAPVKCDSNPTDELSKANEPASCGSTTVKSDSNYCKAFSSKVADIQENNRQDGDEK